MTDNAPKPPPANPGPPEGSPTPFLGGRAFDLMLGLGVLLISVVSLVVAVNANRTQDRMLAASIWPSLLFGTSNVSAEGEPQITFDLVNRGTGPARIRWAQIVYDGQPMADLRQLLETCCGYTGASPGYTSGLHRRVLGADEGMHVVRIPRDEASDALWEQLNLERQKVRLRACYCSVLDDCWIIDDPLAEPEPVKACPAVSGELWHG